MLRLWCPGRSAGHLLLLICCTAPRARLQGPVREVRVGRLGLGLSTKSLGGSGDGSSGGGSLWQALLNGHLLLPISVQGVHVRLAPAPLAAPAAPAAAPEPAAPAAAATPAPGPRSGGKKARAARVPLQLLGHLPLWVDGLDVLDAVRAPLHACRWGGGRGCMGTQGRRAA